MTSAAPYTIGAVEELLGLRRSAITRLIAAGFIEPLRGARNEYRFTFQDVVVLRMAHRLTQARLPLRKIVSSLEMLRARLPSEIPLSGLRITAIGGDVAIRASDAQWEAPSGQLLIDFEVSGERDRISTISALPAGQAEDRDADWHFRQGASTEASDPSRAELAYRAALELEPDHHESLLNLGALLCHLGRCDDAAELYEAALLVRPDNADLYFNLAIALEDQKRYASAAAAYERALEIAPDLADAHYNVGLLYDRLGDGRRAVRHFSAYRRLAPQAPGNP